MLAPMIEANLALDHPNPYSPLAELNAAQRALLRTLLRLVKRLRRRPERLLALYPRAAFLFPRDLRAELEGALAGHRRLVARIVSRTTLLEYAWLLRDYLFPAPFPEVPLIPPQSGAPPKPQMLAVHHVAKYFCRRAVIGNPLTLQVRVVGGGEEEAAQTAGLVGDFFFHHRRRSARYCAEHVRIEAAAYTHRRTAIFEAHKSERRSITCEITGTSGLICTAHAEPFDSHLPPMVVYQRDHRVVLDHLVGPDSAYLASP